MNVSVRPPWASYRNLRLYPTSTFLCDPNWGLTDSPGLGPEEVIQRGWPRRGTRRGPENAQGAQRGSMGGKPRERRGGIQRGSMAAQMGSMMCRGARGAQVAEGVGFLGLLDCCTRPPSASSPGVAHRPQPRKFPFWADRRRRRCPAIARRRAVLGRAFATPESMRFIFGQKPPPWRGEMLPSSAHVCAHPWPCWLQNAKLPSVLATQCPELGIPQKSGPRLFKILIV